MALLFLGLSACGPRAATELVDTSGPRQPRLVLQGSCAPSAVSTTVSVAAETSRCLNPLSSPTLVNTAPDFDALFDGTCERPTIDFTANRVLVIPARGASEWFVFPNFVTERADALEVGLVIRPQGALPPDTLLLLPRTPGAVELRWCRSVCVENCDVAIP